MNKKLNELKTAFTFANLFKIYLQNALPIKWGNQKQSSASNQQEIDAIINASQGKRVDRRKIFEILEIVESRNGWERTSWNVAISLKQLQVVVTRGFDVFPALSWVREINADNGETFVQS